MEHPLDKTLHLDMVPRTSKTLYVQDEFVISDNLSIRVPAGIAALLEKGRPTRTLRPNWLEFPYRIGFNAILFVETGVVDCILNTETFRITNRSVLLIPSATLLRDLSWQAGTRYILFGYNDGKLFSAMTSRSAKILKASMIAPFVLTMDADPGPDGETDPGYLWFVSGNNVSLLDASNSGSVLTFSDAPLCPVSESRTLYLFTWGSDDFPYGSDLWYGKSSLWGVSGSRPVPYRLDNITLGPDETGVSLMETRFLPESGLFRVHALVFSPKIPTPGRGLFDFRYDPVTDALVEIPAP